MTTILEAPRTWISACADCRREHSGSAWPPPLCCPQCERALRAELEVPGWLSSKSPGIAALAQSQYVIARQYPLEYPLWAPIIERLATDQRMEKVWDQIFRRRRTRDRGFECPANKRQVYTHPHWEAVKGLSKKPVEQERLQEEACMVLFSEAAAIVGLDHAAVRVQTVREVEADVAEHRRVSRDLARLGYRQMAVAIRLQAMRKHSRIWLRSGNGRKVRNPWIVGMERTERGIRGIVTHLVITCHTLFSRELARTVATMASVALGREVTEATVRGIAKTIERCALSHHPSG
jgi:hypothetical protein